MGMLYHGFTIAVVLNNGTILNYDFGLDNEEAVALSDQMDLFRNAKTIADIQAGIEAGFVPLSEEFTFMELFEGLGDIDYYEDFLFKLRKTKVENISTIILIADQEDYGDRRYAWRKITLQPYSETSGLKIALYDRQKRKCDPTLNNFLHEELISTEAFTAPQELKSTISASVPSGISLEKFGETFEYFVREKDECFLGIEVLRGITIKGYKGKEKIVTIPETVGGYAIRHISSFGENPYVENCIIPPGVQIADDAFEGCPRIYQADTNGLVVVFGKLVKAETDTVKITLPQGIVSIAHEVFEGNTIIEEVVIPEGVKEISFGAFTGCTALRKVVLPSSLKTIAGNAFANCSALETVDFPQSLEEIGDGAFKDCSALGRVIISSNTKCGSHAFSGCSKALAGPDGITCVGGVMYDIDFKAHMAFHQVPSDTWHFTIPEDVTQIDGDIIFNAPGNVVKTFTITDNMGYINPSDFFLSGIEIFRILDHVTGEVIFETDIFANTPNLLANSERFELLCELIEEKNYDSLCEQFSNNHRKKAIKKTSEPKTPKKEIASQTQVPTSSEPKDLSLYMEMSPDEWMDSYGSFIARDIKIQFSGKAFVLSGSEALGDQHGISLEDEIQERGGIVRSKVSGKTDYLVVNPGWAGEAKVKAAIEQQSKGKPVKIILGEDLIAAMHSKTADTAMPSAAESDKNNVPPSVVSDVYTHNNTEVLFAEPAGEQFKPEFTPHDPDDFLIEGTRLTKYLGKLPAVVVPQGVAEIGNSAFEKCSFLQSVTLPDSLRKISEYAFSECSALQNIVIPDGVEVIEENAFSYCSRLLTARIPGSLKKIGRWVFDNCPRLSVVYLGDGVEIIEDFAFGTELYLDIFVPRSVISIGSLPYGSVIHITKNSWAEKYCKENFEEKYFTFDDLTEEDVSVLQLQDAVVINGVLKCLEISGESIIIPGEAKTIRFKSFTSDLRYEVKTIILSEGVTEIQEQAFSGMRNLERIIFPKSLLKIGDYILEDCNNVPEIVLPEGVQSLSEFAFNYCGQLKDLYLPASISEIGEYAFCEIPSDCKFHVIPGSYAEQYCQENHLTCDYLAPPFDQYQTYADTIRTLKLKEHEQQEAEKAEQMRKAMASRTEFLIEDGVLSGINGYAKKLQIPDQVTQIEPFAFRSDCHLTSVEIPHSVQSIGSNAFSGCESLTQVVFEEGLQEIGSNAFWECKALKSVELPETLQRIGDSVFWSCTQLERVFVPGSITECGSKVFAFNPMLKEVTFSDSVKTIGKDMFYACTALQHVHFPAKLATIDTGAFSTCDSLTEVVLPVGITSIGDKAFIFCDNLTSIHLPPFIKHIGEEAFYGIHDDAVFHVIRGTYAERYCQEMGYTYDNKLDPELLRILQTIIRARKEAAEQKRKEEAAIAERKRQEEAAIAERKRQEEAAIAEKKRKEAAIIALRQRHQRYQEIADAIAETMDVIEKNKGWFGNQAKIRKAAQARLLQLQEQMAREFPTGKP